VLTNSAIVGQTKGKMETPLAKWNARHCIW